MLIRNRLGRSPSPLQRIALVVVLGLTGTLTSICAGAAKRPLTVADAIETTRLMVSNESSVALGNSRWGTASQDGIYVSPDGTRYVAMLIRGDLARDGNWMELITGRTDSLAAAAKVSTVARFFTTSLSATETRAGAPMLTMPGRNPPVWLDDSERVVFYWQDDKGIVQLVCANVRTHEIQYLTQHPNDVTRYRIGHRGALIYAAAPVHSSKQSEALRESGFTVRNEQLMDLLNGNIDGYGAQDRANNSEIFLSRAIGSPARRIDWPGSEMDISSPSFAIIFSADDRLALIDHSAPRISNEWTAYTDKIMQMRMAAFKNAGPRSQAARAIRQLYVLDVETATVRPLWPLPIAAYLRAAFSPDGKSVVVGPTYLPLEYEDEAARTGRAYAVVDVASGRITRLPLNDDLTSGRLESLVWRDEGTIEITRDSKPLEFRQHADSWQLAGTGTSRPQPAAAAIRIEVREGMNEPPTVFAVDVANKRERLILDPNPRLRTEFKLGRVEYVSWNDAQNRTWRGLLYYPVDYVQGRRYPFVIQTHDHAAITKFSLYGWGHAVGTPGLGPGISAYAAQPLANRNIAVLQVEDNVGGLRAIRVTPQEPETYMGAYEAAVTHWNRAGLIDPDKVGLVGYSRTGWHVQYALTQSKTPFAAAITSDNSDMSYIQAAATGWHQEFTLDNGAPPFADGLKTWLERAPAFNAHRINTPLRMQMEMGDLPELAVTQWEMFSRLRFLQKPVELYAVPHFGRGHHALQNPAQCLASQQGAVDWFSFWLQDYEDPQSAKADQYLRWRELRTKRDAAKKAAVTP